MAAEQHCVYLMGEAGTKYVKIGRTGSIAQRRGQVQAGNPRAIVIHFLKPFGTDSDAERFEKDAHAHFAAYRTLGEWFEDKDSAVYTYFAQNAVRHVLKARGRPVATDDDTSGLQLPAHTIQKFKALVRKGGARLTARSIQTNIHCTRAVSRYLVNNIAKYA